MKKPESSSGIKERSDRIINYFLCGYFLVGLLLAFYYDTWTIAIGIGSFSLLAYYIVKIALPDSDAYQYILSAVLGIFMAQYIYEMHGLFEMHFLAFIGSAILITYQKWKLQIPIMVVVVMHHSVFGYLQDAGFGKVYFTQLDYFALQTFIIHILLAGVIFLIGGLWAYQLNKYSRLQITQASNVERLQKEALIAVNTQKEQLERHVAVLDKAVAQGKFEIASDVMHDIGNAVVGFGSYLTKVKHLQTDDHSHTLAQLAGFFEEKKVGMATIMGMEKANAVVEVLSGLVETQRDHREKISKSVSEQINIITNMEDILHIQRQYIEGHEKQPRKPVNLSNIVNDALAMLFSSIDSLGIAVSLAIPEDLPRIKGDRTKLIQVILSVLKNSIEAIRLGGTERAISITAGIEAGELSLQIRDTGKGFGEGLGAGLSLNNCQTILDSHAGTIRIASDGIGKGTVTSIRFRVGG